MHFCSASPSLHLPSHLQQRRPSPRSAGQAGACAGANLDLIEEGRLTLGTTTRLSRHGGAAARPEAVEDVEPVSGQGYESAVAYAVAQQLGFAKRQVDWRAVPFAQSYRPGEELRLLSGPGLVHAGAGGDGRCERVLLRLPVARGTRGYGHRSGTLYFGPQSFTLGAQLGTTSYQYIANYIKPSQALSSMTRTTSPWSVEERSDPERHGSSISRRRST